MDSRKSPTSAWIAYASGVISALGVAFLVSMFASFAIGATSAGMVLGWINDVLVLLSYALALPLAFAIFGLTRIRAPILAAVTVLVGIGALVAIVVLQALLVGGWLTFEQQIGSVSVAFVGLAVWFVAVGYLGSSTGVLPNGIRMGLLAATYIGYPIWAFWLGRHLTRASPTT